MDTAQWPQEIVVKPIEDIVVTSTCAKPAVERKPRPQKEQALNCPRCHSTNTKFCYYNNYSLTQPRYFCKTCRRYWTEGGSLRNIPVGGGSRKNKRSSSASCSSPPPKKLPDLITPQNPKSIHEGQDLNLAFRNISELVQQNNNNAVSASASASSNSTITTTSTSTAHHQLSALELLTGITSGSRGLNSFMPVSDPYGSGFPLQDFIKPTLNFSLEGIASGYASLHLQGTSVQDTTGRLLFPFEDLKQVSSTTPAIMDQNNSKAQHQGDSNGGYWTGMLGDGAGSW